MPARSTMATVASTAAMIHTTFWVPRTSMPTSDARSRLWALALTAVPTPVRLRKAMRPMIARGTMIMASRSLTVKTNGSISKVKSIGGLNLGKRRSANPSSSLNSVGM